MKLKPLFLLSALLLVSLPFAQSVRVGAASDVALLRENDPTPQELLGKPVAFHSVNGSNLLLLFDASGNSLNDDISFNYIFTNSDSPRTFGDMPFGAQTLLPGRYTIVNIDFGGGDVEEINKECGRGNTFAHCVLEYFRETLAQHHALATFAVEGAEALLLQDAAELIVREREAAGEDVPQAAPEHSFGESEETTPVDGIEEGSTAETGSGEEENIVPASSSASVSQEQEQEILSFPVDPGKETITEPLNEKN